MILSRAQDVPIEDVDYVAPDALEHRLAIVASIVGTIVVSIVWRDGGKKDQRDKEIDRIGEYTGQSFLVIGGLAGLILAMLEADWFWIANTLYLGFILSAHARLGHQDRALPPGLAHVVKPTRVTNTIRALRFAHGEMTQAELADRIGVTRQTVIAIEQGRYSPSLEMAFQIAHVFGVPLDEVFQYPDPVDRPDARPGHLRLGASARAGRRAPGPRSATASPRSAAVVTVSPAGGVAPSRAPGRDDRAREPEPRGLGQATADPGHGPDLAGQPDLADRDEPARQRHVLPGADRGQREREVGRRLDRRGRRRWSTRRRPGRRAARRAGAAAPRAPSPAGCCRRRWWSGAGWAPSSGRPATAPRRRAAGGPRASPSGRCPARGAAPAR